MGDEPRVWPAPAPPDLPGHRPMTWRRRREDQLFRVYFENTKTGRFRFYTLSLDLP